MLRIEELKLTDDQLDLLENWLRKHDVRLFANKYTLGKARKEFNEFMEGELMEGSVRAADFSACVHHFCEFFKQGRRRHYRHNNELTHDQWDQVRMVATR